MRLLPVKGAPKRGDSMSLGEFKDSLTKVRKKALRRVRDDWGNFIASTMKETVGKLPQEAGYDVQEPNMETYKESNLCRLMKWTDLTMADTLRSLTRRSLECYTEMLEGDCDVVVKVRLQGGRGAGVQSVRSGKVPCQC